MSIKVKFTDIGSGSYSTYIDKKPDTCPLCNQGIDPKQYMAYRNGYSMQIVYRCPRENCQSVFIGYYSNFPTDEFTLRKTQPKNFEGTTFAETVTNISKEFQAIYNDAEAAENLGLTNICGCGYRKALEYLIKDFAIKMEEDEKAKEKIATKLLGKVIVDDIEDKNIRNVAKRAAWLGNDETHYIRKWKSMGLDELKDLLHLVVIWIDSDQTTKKYVKDMPD